MLPYFLNSFEPCRKSIEEFETLRRLCVKNISVLYTRYVISLDASQDKNTDDLCAIVRRAQIALNGETKI